jgi:hypothetical protein
VVEHFLGKEEVLGSSPSGSFGGIWAFGIRQVGCGLFVVGWKDFSNPQQTTHNKHLHDA